MTTNEMVDTLHDVLDYLDDRSDVNDGANGQPVANRAMRLERDVKRMVEYIEDEVANAR